jgi:hypothetical protein
MKRFPCTSVLLLTVGLLALLGLWRARPPMVQAQPSPSHNVELVVQIGIFVFLSAVDQPTQNRDNNPRRKLRAVGYTFALCTAGIERPALHQTDWPWYNRLRDKTASLAAPGLISPLHGPAPSGPRRCARRAARPGVLLRLV